MNKELQHTRRCGPRRWTQTNLWFWRTEFSVKTSTKQKPTDAKPQTLNTVHRNMGNSKPPPRRTSDRNEPNERQASDETLWAPETLGLSGGVNLHCVKVSSITFSNFPHALFCPPTINGIVSVAYIWRSMQVLLYLVPVYVYAVIFGTPVWSCFYNQTKIL